MKHKIRLLIFLLKKRFARCRFCGKHTKHLTWSESLKAFICNPILGCEEKRQ